MFKIAIAILNAKTCRGGVTVAGKFVHRRALVGCQLAVNGSEFVVLIFTHEATPLLERRLAVARAATFVLAEKSEDFTLNLLPLIFQPNTVATLAMTLRIIHQEERIGM
jgi:hypothetical protein